MPRNKFREKLIMAALTGLCGNINRVVSTHSIAKKAIEVADFVILELEKEEKKDPDDPQAT